MNENKEKREFAQQLEQIAETRTQGLYPYRHGR